MNSLLEIVPVAASLLVIFLLSSSAVAWWRLIRHGPDEAGLGWNDAPRAPWTTMAELTSVGLVILLIALFLSAAIAGREPVSELPEVMTTEKMTRNALLNFSMALVLPGILIAGSRPLSDFGIRFRNVAGQLRDGWNGYLLALLPMLPFLIATMPFRTRDTQNSLLRILQDHPDPLMIVLVFLMAVVIAPVFEEMVFRVILQGWLATWVPASVAIPVTAVVFAGIHGLVDGIALIPLSLVLGWVFFRRHSYLAVLVIHGLFNATMLLLTLLSLLKPAT